MENYETYYNLVFGLLTVLGLSAIIFALLYNPKPKSKKER